MWIVWHFEILGTKFYYDFARTNERIRESTRDRRHRIGIGVDMIGDVVLS